MAPALPATLKAATTVAPPATSLSPWTAPPGSDASGVVVSKLLEAIFKMMLASHGSVHAEVSSRIGRLARGSVLGALVVGRSLRTPLGLTGRELQVLVPDGARLDSRALLQGRLALAERTRGMAEIVFDEADFAHFLSYPQVVAARSARSGFAFAASGVEIGPCAVYFRGSWHEHTRQVLVALSWSGGGRRNAGGGPSVQVLQGIEDPEEVDQLERSVAAFFADLTLDLAGLTLRLAALDFVPVAEGTGGVSCRGIRLRLEGEILRIPDPLREQI